MPESWYSNPRELLEALCIGTAAIIEGNEESETEYTLQKKLRQSLRILPSFIVVDDIDSLDANEQRRVFELVQQVSAGATSKFLLTTRANYAFSNEQCVEVEGLEGDPYVQFVKDRLRRLGLNDLRPGEIKMLHSSSSGSPLWTESLLRLMRQGYSFEEAIKQWRGKPGEDARSAALRKELQALSSTAKRILFAASVLRECSRAELLEITKTGRVEFDEAINQLQTLFLVDAPKLIKNEPRFSVPESTANAVFDIETELVDDHKRLRNGAREYARRTASSNGMVGRRRVGLIVNQTMALLRAGAFTEALATVDQALHADQRNPDLLLLKGRCLRSTDAGKAAEAFAAAYRCGQRKGLLFDLWYDAANEQKQIAVTLDVANLALDNQLEQSQWLPLRARAHVQIALMRNRDGDAASAVDSLKKAASDLRQSAELVKQSARQAEMHRSDLFSVNDVAWKLTGDGNIEANLLAFDVAINAVNLGDTRAVSFERISAATSRLVSGTNLSSESNVARAARTRQSEALRTLKVASSTQLFGESAAACEKAIAEVSSL